MDVPHGFDLVIVGRAPSGYVVRFTGDLDLSAAQGLEDQLVELGQVSGLYIDLSDLAFIDSSGIGSIIRTRKRLAEMERDLVLVNPRPAVRRVLEVLNLTQLIGEGPE